MARALNSELPFRRSLVLPIAKTIEHEYQPLEKRSECVLVHLRKISTMSANSVAYDEYSLLCFYGFSPRHGKLIETHDRFFFTT